MVRAGAGGNGKGAGDGAAGPARCETGAWRERAINAESELKRAHGEIAAQRGQIGELLGRIRDLEHDLPEDGIQRTINENHNLRAQVRQLTQDTRRTEDRLAGARDTNRSPDKRIAGLAPDLPPTTRGQHDAP